MVNKLLSTMGIHLGNLEEYPVLGMNYFIVLGSSILSFSKISGLHLYGANIKPVLEGGRFEPYMVEESMEELHTMTLEKGVGTIDMLNVIKRANFMILIIKNADNSLRTAYYTNTIMVKDIKLTDLEAQSSRVLIQSMSIAYTHLKRFELLNRMGKFDATSEFLGEIMSYNNNQADLEAIQTYTAKLKQQKETNAAAKQAQRQTQAATSQSAVSFASEQNQSIAQEEAEKQKQQEDMQQKAQQEIFNRLEL